MENYMVLGTYEGLIKQKLLKLFSNMVSSFPTGVY